MASESTARSSDPTVPPSVESPNMPESGRRPERRTAATAGVSATLAEVEVEDHDFEPHDTIPAPPWHDDADAPSSPEAS